MPARTVNLSVGFQEARTRAHQWFQQHGYQVDDQGIQYGCKLKIETKKGPRAIRLHFSSKKKGTRLVLEDPHFEEAFLLAEFLGSSESLGSDPKLAAFASLSRIGSDESGKGDYFGPLVAVSVFVRTEKIEALQRLGVRDSKLLTDGDAARIAEGIRSISPNWKAVIIGPERYNTLYATSMEHNLNEMLAWAHARAMEDLREELEKTEAEIDRVPTIVDRFAAERVLIDKLFPRARRAPLFQTPRAEADVVVAAASILARAEFLAALGRLSREVGVTLPKGASARVDAVGADLVKRNGPEILDRVAKRHFKNTQRVLQTAAH